MRLGHNILQNATNELFCQKVTVYIRIKNPLHKQSEKACMCFKTRQTSTRDYMVNQCKNISIDTTFHGISQAHICSVVQKMKFSTHFYLKSDTEHLECQVNFKGKLEKGRKITKRYIVGVLT